MVVMVLDVMDLQDQEDHTVGKERPDLLVPQVKWVPQEIKETRETEEILENKVKPDDKEW
jgi:hypothetical protein